MKNTQIEITFSLDNPFKRWNWDLGRVRNGIQIITPVFILFVGDEALLPASIKYYFFSKSLLEAHYHIACICSDPMNGCPGDFAEDFERKHRGDELKLYRLESSCFKFTKWIADQFLKKVELRLSAQYSELPWNE